MARWLSAFLLVTIAGCAEDGPAQTAPAAVAVQAPPPADPRDRNLDRTMRLIRATEDDDPQKPDFLYRAAEQYIDKWRRPAPGDPQPARWMERAIACYQSAAVFSTYARADEVLFKLACLLQDAGRDEEARASFDRIIKEHPDSRFVSEAWARRR
jgi:hypothetical protein